MSTEQEWATQLRKSKLRHQAALSIDVEKELGLLQNQIEYQKIKLKQAIEMNDVAMAKATRSVLIAHRGRQAELELIAEQQQFNQVSPTEKERILRSFYIDVAKLVRYTEKNLH